MDLFSDGIGSLMESLKDRSQWSNPDENLELSVSWH